MTRTSDPTTGGPGIYRPSIYRMVMDPSVNPLRALPPGQRFQLMSTLAMMWTAIFCAATGAWLWYGELIVGHILVAAGFIITGMTFRNATKGTQRRVATHRDQPAHDGTTRYDDVWGG
ncbi:MAG: hypothetical protein GDA49_01510 [Rhodospirillales bacterium]|nr:hypothetical protein [Rhodospirillales bacterium]